jgi:hypothetical protein
MWTGDPIRFLIIRRFVSPEDELLAAIASVLLSAQGAETTLTHDYWWLGRNSDNAYVDALSIRDIGGGLRSARVVTIFAWPGKEGFGEKVSSLSYFDCAKHLTGAVEVTITAGDGSLEGSSSEPLTDLDMVVSGSPGEVEYTFVCSALGEWKRNPAFIHVGTEAPISFTTRRRDAGLPLY